MPPSGDTNDGFILQKSGGFSQLRWLFDLIGKFQAGNVLFDGGNSSAAKDEFFEFHVQQTNHWNHHREAEGQQHSSGHALVIGQQKINLRLHCGLEDGGGFAEESVCAGCEE